VLDGQAHYSIPGELAIVTIAEVAKIRLDGTGLTARNLLLNQWGRDLIITFDGKANTSFDCRDSISLYLWL